MAETRKTAELLKELEAIDQREGRILDVLLRRGARLEHQRDEAERRSRVVTVGELRALADALARADTAIEDVQGQIARAEAGSPAPPSNGAPSPATFEALAASLRLRDAEADQLQALLRERLLALGESPGNGAHDPPRTFRLVTPRMSGEDVRAFQRELNQRFEAWGIGKQIALNGNYCPRTRHAARQVARGLGIAPAECERGFTPALRGIIRTPSRRTPQQLERARRQRPWLRRLRAQHATGAPQSSGGPRPPVPARPGLAAAIRAAGGRYAVAIVREARRSKLSPALVCAVVEQETHFRNVFGHDGGPGHTNPVKSPPGGVLEVTRERYQEYLRHRGRGLQGVGPMQLTSAHLQDRADDLGGCWQPGPNIRVGCEHLAAKIKARGLVAGVQAYNGAPGDAYAKEVLERERAWRRRLAGASASTGAGAPQAGPKRPPRTFRVTRPQMSGADVKAFQRELNRRLEAWKIDQRIAEDGGYGAGDAAGRAAGRARARRRGGGLRARDHARAARPDPRARPADAAAARPRAQAPPLAAQAPQAPCDGRDAAAACPRRGEEAPRHGRDGDRRQQPGQDGHGDHQGQRRPWARAVVRRLHGVVLPQGRLQERHARLGGRQAVPAADRPQADEHAAEGQPRALHLRPHRHVRVLVRRATAGRSREPARRTSRRSRATRDAPARCPTRRRAATAST